MKSSQLRPITFVLAGVVLAACSSAIKQPVAEAKKIPIGIQVSVNPSDKKVVLPPHRITVDRNEYLGTSIDWEAGRDKVVTTYVYMLGHLGKEVLTEAEALKILDERFRAEMKMAIENGMYKKVGALDKAATSFSVPVPSGERTGLKRLMRMEGEQRYFQSLTYLFYREPFAVKYRISFSSNADLAYADQFVLDSYQTLEVSWPELCRKWQANNPKSRTIGVNTKASAAEQADQVLAGVVRLEIVGAKFGCGDLEQAMHSQKLLEQFRAEQSAEKGDSKR